MNKCLIVCFLSATVAFTAASQTVIKGVVYDKESKKPLEGVVVSVPGENNEVQAYDISSSQGWYSLTVGTPGKSIKISGRLLGYKEELLDVANVSAQIDIYMTPSSIELREVVITPPAISASEDTLRYNVNSFVSPGDRTIGDVLKKLPGIEVNKGGGITYKGELINKFYIEGLDLLGEKYGIATNNVPADAVGNVEIIENHQPIRSIKGMIESSRSAINLKLKSGKLKRPIGGARAGGGYSGEANWLLEAFALQASPGKQAIALYKTNNSGNDVSVELAEPGITVKDQQGTDPGQTKNILTPDGLSHPPIEKERYLFNRSHVASLNSLWKTNEHTQVRINVNYLNNKLNENSFSDSEYFLNDNPPLKVAEQNRLTQKKQSLDGTILFTNNASSVYLDNALKWKIDETRSISSTATNGENVGQRFKIPSAYVQNKLDFFKTFDRRIWHIDAVVSYSTRPEQLVVYGAAAPEKQTVGKTDLNFKTGSYYSWFRGFSSLRLRGDLEASSSAVDTELSGVVFSDMALADSLQTKMSIKTIGVEIAPLYTFKKERTTIEIELPVKNQTFLKTDKLRNTPATTEHFFFVNYRASLSHKFNPYLNARLSFRFNQNLGDHSDFIDAYLMKNYRNFYKPAGVVGLRKSHSVAFRINYKNPIQSLFMNGFLSYSPTESNKTVATLFHGTRIERRDILSDNKSDVWLGQFYIGKYFGAIKTNLSLSTNFNRYASSRFQQGVLYPFQINALVHEFKANVKISDRLAGEYKTSFLTNNSVVKLRGDIRKSSLSLFTQQLKTYLTLAKNVDITSQIEHTSNEVTENSSVNLLFVNLGITYKLKRVSFELYCNNIFNNKTYAYTMLEELSSYSYAYDVRPGSLMLIASFKF